MRYSKHVEEYDLVRFPFTEGTFLKICIITLPVNSITCIVYCFYGQCYINSCVFEGLLIFLFNPPVYDPHQIYKNKRN